MKIHGLPGVPESEVRQVLAGGGRLVRFEYCISLLFLTLRRQSRVFLLAADDPGLVDGLPYTLVTLLLGWWGVPWGLVGTPLALLTNLTGGRDVTAEVAVGTSDEAR